MNFAHAFCQPTLTTPTTIVDVSIFMSRFMLFIIIIIITTKPATWPLQSKRQKGLEFHVCKLISISIRKQMDNHSLQTKYERMDGTIGRTEQLILLASRNRVESQLIIPDVLFRVSLCFVDVEVIDASSSRSESKTSPD